jgi:hypothetical protein
MDRTEHLHDQISRAERLARGAFDKLTVERLRAFAEECREQLKAMPEQEMREARPRSV